MLLTRGGTALNHLRSRRGERKCVTTSRPITGRRRPAPKFRTQPVETNVDSIGLIEIEMLVGTPWTRTMYLRVRRRSSVLERLRAS
jgi:hypothetical protein